MYTRSATNQLTSTRSSHKTEFRVQSLALPHSKPFLKPRPRQKLRQLQAAVLLEQEACTSRFNRPAILEPSNASPIHRVYMTVPPTDVDLYGVVRNTMYPEYMYAARLAFAASVGFSLEALLEQHGVMTATTSFTIQFKSPLQCGDRFFVESVPSEVGSITFKFRERVVRLSSSGEEQQVVAEGEATCVALLAGCPPKKVVRPPAPLKKLLLSCIPASTAAAN